MVRGAHGRPARSRAWISAPRSPGSRSAASCSGSTALASPTFAGFPQRAAQVAYLQSYALIDYLARQRGERSLADFLDALIQSRNLDRALRRVYRLDAATLEARFCEELG